MSRVENDFLDGNRLSASSTFARLVYCDTMPSTQDHALELARSQAGPLPILVVAEEQTAGRGRGANRWWTARGSLAFSLLFDPAAWGLAPQPVPERSLAVGVAIVDAIGPRLLNCELGLHWPNDVFAEGRKISGVLVDVLPDGKHVIGVGINVNNLFQDAPAEVQARATSLAELSGRSYDRTQVLLDVLISIQHALIESARRAAEFGARFDELCLQRGRELTLDVGQQRVSGICAGVAPDGALLLDTARGREKFYSGVLRHDA
jgi:BirA family biotin operon repressor/biotin-[acetyl-CoA-carboxylase] ligase